MSDVLRRLAEPFAPSDIEWRVQTAGERNGKPWARVLAYVTNRAIMDRLDDVVGPADWRNEYKEGPAGGVVCGLSIRVTRGVAGDGDGQWGEWVTKWDGAENSEIEPVKGGLSNAMKRAAVQWGIGRALYHLEEAWADVTDSGQFSAKTKDGKWFKWNPPQLPTWALPGGSGKPDGSAPPLALVRGATTTPSHPATSSGGGNGNAAPSTATTTQAPNAAPNGARRGEHHGSPGLDPDGIPLCPKCGGRMWDDRASKRNPKAPDFKCRKKGECDGVIWPDKKGAAPVTVPADDELPPFDDDDAPF